MKVRFFFAEKITLKDRTKLKLFIAKLFVEEGFKLKSLSYIFCSDEFLLSLNKSFLKHNYYTDILTFDLSSNKDEIEGEIYISRERVNENAEKLGISFTNELHRVIFHGALHLCGYKDKNQADKTKIRRAEDYYLNHYFKK